MAESKTSKRLLAGVDNQAAALELRKAGKSFEVIASTLGYASPSGAYQAVQAALKAMIHEPAAEVLRLEVSRLDAILEPVYARARETGDPHDVASALAIMARRAKYLGLDVPMRMEIVQEEADRLALAMGLNASDIMKEAEDMLAGK